MQNAAIFTTKNWFPLNNLLTPEDFVEVGYIGGLYGYEGLLRVNLDAGILGSGDSIVKFLYFMENGMFVPRFISVRDQNQSLVGFERFGSRESARILTDQKVYLRKTDLPDFETQENLSEDLFFIHLEGFQIYDVNTDMTLGKIESVEEYPAGWMAEVRLNTTGNQVLIPLALPLIHQLEMDQKRVRMDLPEGLLEL